MTVTDRRPRTLPPIRSTHFGNTIRNVIRWYSPESLLKSFNFLPSSGTFCWCYLRILISSIAFGPIVVVNPIFIGRGLILKEMSLIQPFAFPLPSASGVVPHHNPATDRKLIIRLYWRIGEKPGGFLGPEKNFQFRFRPHHPNTLLNPISKLWFCASNAQEEVPFLFLVVVSHCLYVLKSSSMSSSSSSESTTYFFPYLCWLCFSINEKRTYRVGNGL